MLSTRPITWRGRPVEELSREELIRAVYDFAKLVDSYRQMEAANREVEQAFAAARKVFANWG